MQATTSNKQQETSKKPPCTCSRSNRLVRSSSRYSSKFLTSCLMKLRHYFSLRSGEDSQKCTFNNVLQHPPKLLDAFIGIYSSEWNITDILGSRRCPRSCACRGGRRCGRPGWEAGKMLRPTSGDKLPESKIFIARSLETLSTLKS